MGPPTSNAAGIRRGYAAGGGGQIHYRRAGPSGARSPLLLLHPSPSSGYVFETFMLEMGRDRSVIAPDLPGYGMSDPPIAPPHIAEYAAAMLALESTLGLGLFDVMGYHIGGLVAAEMAHQQPKSVRKIVMIAAPMFDEPMREKLRTAPSAAFEERARAFPQAWVNFKTAFWRGSDEARAWNLYVEAQRNPATALWGQWAAADYDLGNTLGQLAQPVLVLNPDDELASLTPKVAPFLKNGRVHDLPGWSHGFLDDRTAEAAAIVRGFLDQDDA